MLASVFFEVELHLLFVKHRSLVSFVFVSLLLDVQLHLVVD